MSVKNREKLLARVNAVVGAAAGSAAGDPSYKVFRVRAVATQKSFESTNDLIALLNSEAGKSVYVKGDNDNLRRVKGVYLRVDDELAGLLKARVKLVHPSFHRMVEVGRWEGDEKNTVRHDLWLGLNNDGLENSDETEIK